MIDPESGRYVPPHHDPACFGCGDNADHPDRAGTCALQQLQSGVPPEKILASWSAALTAFDQVRRKYFLYK